MNYNELTKHIIGAPAGLLLGALDLAWPVALTCTVLVLADCASALLMLRRLRKAGRAADCRFSSRRFGKVAVTLGRLYCALLAAALLQITIIEGQWTFDAVRFLGGTFCFRQIMSILENESCCNPSGWARWLRRLLADKSKRYTGGSASENDA